MSPWLLPQQMFQVVGKCPGKCPRSLTEILIQILCLLSEDGLANIHAGVDIALAKSGMDIASTNILVPGPRYCPSKYHIIKVECSCRFLGLVLQRYCRCVFVRDMKWVSWTNTDDFRWRIAKYKALMNYASIILNIIARWKHRSIWWHNEERVTTTDYNIIG